MRFEMTCFAFVAHGIQPGIRHHQDRIDSIGLVELSASQQYHLIEMLLLLLYSKVHQSTFLCRAFQHPLEA